MLKRIMAVMIVTGLILGGGMANAIDFGPSKVLTDKAGAKYEVAGENLMIIILGSKKTPAKDGDYTFTDGSKLTVKGGKIVSKTTVQPVKAPTAAVSVTTPVQPKTETPKELSTPTTAMEKQNSTMSLMEQQLERSHQLQQQQQKNIR